MVSGFGVAGVGIMVSFVGVFVGVVVVFAADEKNVHLIHYSRRKKDSN